MHPARTTRSRATGLLNARWALILRLIGLFMPFSVARMRAHFVAAGGLADAARWTAPGRGSASAASSFRSPAAARLAGGPALPVDLEPVPPRSHDLRPAQRTVAGRWPSSRGTTATVPSAHRRSASDHPHDPSLRHLPAAVHRGAAAGLGQGMTATADPRPSPRKGPRACPTYAHQHHLPSSAGTVAPRSGRRDRRHPRPCATSRGRGPTGPGGASSSSPRRNRPRTIPGGRGSLSGSPAAGPSRALALSFYHGGGMVMGSLDGGDPIAVQLGEELGAAVISVDDGSPREAPTRLPSTTAWTRWLGTAEPAPGAIPRGC